MAIFSNRCYGCKQIEPLLPQLKRHLQLEYGRDIDVLKMDIRNEISFLKQVDKTPSFLVYEHKGNFFWDLDMRFGESLTREERISAKMNEGNGEQSSQ